ncbi:MAG: PorT family protein [Hymenobacter sp.]|nr:MAG: PorT family protein [Hymenobacter sp.]
MNNCLPLALALLTTAAAAQAQTRFRFGPQVGYSQTTINYNPNSQYNEAAIHYTSGFSAGVLADIGFGHWAIQPALQFAQKGYDQTITERFVYPNSRTVDIHTQLNYLALPLNVAYTQRPDGQGAQVFAGPYVGLLLGGHYTTELARTSQSGTQYESYSGQVVAAESFTPSFTDTNSYSRRLDAGLQLGLGYRYQGLLAQASYSLGLRDLQSRLDDPNSGYYDPEPTYQSRAFQFSLGYLFGANY